MAEQDPQPPRYKSEVFVPIHKDKQSFEERQKGIWDNLQGRSLFDDMHQRMEQRRRDWDSEVGKMRKDFFRLKPMEDRRDSSDNLFERLSLDDIFYDDHEAKANSVETGDKRFRVTFDVSQFKPEEICVSTENNKLVVHAKHEEAGSGSNVSREFKRQFDIPKHVDSQKLISTLSKDGILQIEAPVPAPAYQQIQETAQTHKFPAHVIAPLSSQKLQMGVQHEYRAGPVVTEKDGAKIMKLTVDIGTDYKPEDISVKTVDKKLLVTARHEESSAGRTSVREFNREFELPGNVDPNSVTASMTEDGKLLVEAPLVGFQEGHYEGREGSSKAPRVMITMR
jgi:HSP20 family molecular chaperone IbpA